MVAFADPITDPAAHSHLAQSHKPMQRGLRRPHRQTRRATGRPSARPEGIVDATLCNKQSSTEQMANKDDLHARQVSCSEQHTICRPVQSSDQRFKSGTQPEQTNAEQVDNNVGPCV